MVPESRLAPLSLAPDDVMSPAAGIPGQVRVPRFPAPTGYNGHGVPVLHPERGVQHCLPPRPDRARRRDRPARRGDPAGGVRADRWYKLWRTILYGALEDERPFYSVRQLTQYENHGLRLLRYAGVATAAPYGIVEITLERGYLLVTELFIGAVEIGTADIDDDIID
jgi:hypothetical protein